jgi:hypothetical protein
MPPSPEIPNTINNLTVTERGDELVIYFSTPARTTDSLAIREFENLDLRVGPSVTPFDFERWAAGAKPYEIDIPSPSDKDDPQPKPVSLKIPAAEWQGQHVAIAVRSSVRKKGHFSAWSNRVVMDVLAPLQPPVVTWEGTGKGVALSWKASSETRYEVFRQGPSDKAPINIGSADDGFFVDPSAQYDTNYAYSVVAKSGAAESLPSKILVVNFPDKFPPAVPASITALAGPETIEVSWQRSPDSDLQGYFVYRSTNKGSYERQGTMINVPTYTDKQVQHGKTYSYEVSAVDRKGNESDKSSATEVSF